MNLRSPTDTEALVAHIAGLLLAGDYASDEPTCTVKSVVEVAVVIVSEVQRHSDLSEES